MSKQGLHDCLNKLIDERRIIRNDGKTGEYLPIIEKTNEDEERKQ